MLRRISESEPRPISEASPEMPRWICGVIHTPLAKSAEAVAELLGQCLAHTQQPSVHKLPQQAQELVTQDAKKSNSSPWRLFAIGTACAVAIALLILTTSAAGLYVYLRGGNIDTGPLATESGNFDSSGSFADDHESLIDGRLLGWDDVAVELEKLRIDTESLERSTADSWDDIAR